MPKPMGIFWAATCEFVYCQGILGAMHVFAPNERTTYPYYIHILVRHMFLCRHTDIFHRFTKGVPTTKLGKCFSYISTMYPWHGFPTLQSQRIHFIYNVKAFRLLNCCFFFSSIFLSVGFNKLWRIWFNLNSKQGENLLFLRLCASHYQHTHTCTWASYVCTHIAWCCRDPTAFWTVTRKMRRIKRVRAGWKVLWDKFNIWIFYAIFIMNGVEYKTKKAGKKNIITTSMWPTAPIKEHTVSLVWA